MIYVGKAKSLRSRLSNYFADPVTLPVRTAQMVAGAETVEWIEVRNEVEALMLEYNLIKAHRPRFNIRLRDDKSYPFLALTLDDEWARATVRRGARPKGTRYFGPYAHAWAIRETLDSLLRSFPIRTCSDAKLQRHHREGRPCLLFHIEKCAGPCVGEVTKQAYDVMVGELVKFLEGDTQPVIERLEADMRQAATDLEYERAARIRDRLGGIQRAIQKQQMVTEKPEDVDLIGIADDELEAAVQVFHVRKGRVMGRKGFIVDKVEELSPGQLVEHVLQQMYGDDPILGVPREVLVPDLPTNVDVVAEWLTSLRGGVVGIRVPQRGDKRSLHETVTRNAAEEFTRHRIRRSADHNSRARALNALQDALDLPAAPLRIECYDMSHIQGTDYVGSMVVLEDGLTRPSEYRRFKVKGVAGNDDYAAMEEVLTRRLKALLAERDQADDESVVPETLHPANDEASAIAALQPSSLDAAASDVIASKKPYRPKKFSYPPQLLLVDGGKGQLSVAVRVLESLGLSDEIPVAALAKQFEEIFVPGRSEPIRIPRTSEALYLLQTIRDEAHRFAITYHRQLRAKRMTKSVLDDIPGLGPTRTKRLAKELGGASGVKKATLEELHALTWLPGVVADAVHDRLHGPAKK